MALCWHNLQTVCRGMRAGLLLRPMVLCLNSQRVCRAWDARRMLWRMALRCLNLQRVCGPGYEKGFWDPRLRNWRCCLNWRVFIAGYAYEKAVLKHGSALLAALKADEVDLDGDWATWVFAQYDGGFLESRNEVRIYPPPPPVPSWSPFFQNSVHSIPSSRVLVL
jgi:hypothetical protein